MSQNKVREICFRLLSMFESGDLPPAIARTVIKRQAGEERPSNHWSISNQILMLISGTDDARGFRQWQDANRSVRKGTKAIHILDPIIKRVTRTSMDTTANQAVQDELTMIKGFRPVPVFRIEDTDGEPIPGYKYDPPELPPLFDVAQHFGIVRYLPHYNRELGSCSTSGNITLYTADVDVFFHELGHQVHNTIKPLMGGQHTGQELVAEMTSCVLCELYGYQGYLWGGWKYMQGYTDQEPAKTLRAIMGVMNDVDAVIGKILAVEH